MCSHVFRHTRPNTTSDFTEDGGGRGRHNVGLRVVGEKGMQAKDDLYVKRIR